MSGQSERELLNSEISAMKNTLITFLIAATALLAEDVPVVVTPEPSTLVIFGSGVIALIALKKRFKK